jgi:hypothetical protein
MTKVEFFNPGKLSKETIERIGVFKVYHKEATSNDLSTAGQTLKALLSFFENQTTYAEKTVGQIEVLEQEVEKSTEYLNANTQLTQENAELLEKIEILKTQIDEQENKTSDQDTTAEHIEAIELQDEQIKELQQQVQDLNELLANKDNQIDTLTDESELDNDEFIIVLNEIERSFLQEALQNKDLIKELQGDNKRLSFDFNKEFAPQLCFDFLFIEFLNMHILQTPELSNKIVRKLGTKKSRSDLFNMITKKQ